MTKRHATSSPCYAQLLGVRRCAVFRWKDKDCCLFLFNPSSTQDVGSRSVSSLGVPFTSGLGLLFLSTTTRWLPVWSDEGICWWLVLCLDIPRRWIELWKWFVGLQFLCLCYQTCVLSLCATGITVQDIPRWWTGLCNCLIFLSLFWSISEKLFGLVL